MCRRPRRSQDDRMEADVVVVGAGHNGLICAAYLARAGLEVAVLEARPIPGGNTVTEELTLPGFAHDSCSSAHVLIQSNPLLQDDELGLLSTWGLRYEHTDPAVVLPRADGDTLVMHRDLDATADELARYSPADATAFRDLIGEWTTGLAAVHGRWSSGFDLGDTPPAKAYAALRARSAWDVVHERFSHPAVRDLMVWLSLATIQDPRREGTGVLPSSIAAGRLRFGWSTPIGGSGALPAALLRLLEAHGATLHTTAEVDHVAVRDGRVTGVRTFDGRTFTARRAVVMSSNVARLPDMLDEVPTDLAAAKQAWRPGLSVFAVHAALRTDLAFTNGLHSVAAGLGDTAGIARQLDAFYRGETDTTNPWLLVVNQSVVDRTRAPEGAGTFKILTIAPWTRADARPWSKAKADFGADLIDLVRTRVPTLDPISIRMESPHDIAAHNPHNVGGSCHGGEFHLPTGERLVGWPHYTTSIPGLFLTGSTSHPGGSVSGRPGRNTARTILSKLGLNPATVMGPR
ncbi:phytoene desaturase family protein [Paractinoplanes lichenicola]|uniref:Pyridine nucleotide-disulfide oxidoreductase domain-containing protein 2 n=1 Tax=Paractinoplanes lichenicola TaxID=2802976 RepID=A0ABS1W347_9ACTN|nr:NAD(P)/FAD-dependent oxidoreductase [Actinoplanes lichenicola]MBL7261117.1 NAD(P)/FAD-dependent oxidoreductase [Actinoplanes lichenicola]